MTLSEQAAEDLIAARAFSSGLPGFVGIAVDLLLDPACAPTGRRPLRHGFLDTRSPRLLVVSGPPSPGIEVALKRMTDDLAAAGRVVEGHGLTVLAQATDTAHPEGPAHALGTATAGIRVGLEAGLDGGGPLGIDHRWALAHTLAPVLAASFANAPLRHGRPTGWRSVRQSLRRDTPVLPPVVGSPFSDSPTIDGFSAVDGGSAVLGGSAVDGGSAVAGGSAVDGGSFFGGGSLPSDPARSWAAHAMNAPTATGRTLRQAIRAGARLTPDDVDRHLAALRPPVAARGHLEIDVADRQPGTGWRIPAVVAAALIDDPRAADEAWQATAHLGAEPRLWERAARDALTDTTLAAAARDCFMAAYGALARLGVSRELRDDVAEFTERYVFRGRCPADDVLDQVAARS
ncbi:glutamate-cysteine ligase family protein [Actinoplanes sp. NBRC 101535]|uniref:glutamate-cysteine ligase family protein n=1 Tax=Actinoplanes sp. NBRC 101535 TaxID=3032196 RepID=UPI00255294F1|nr:glutamate-cysteine ligase family protein [Actinoplanes sp. NBRC 101535]